VFRGQRMLGVKVFYINKEQGFLSFQAAWFVCLRFFSS
jgi:hypothetical protein